MNLNNYSRFCVFAVVVASPTLLGCGGSDRPELGLVEGVVTLDGTPLANAYVSFKPANAKAASGVTDETGRYELFYIRDIKGGVIGANTVRITTATEGKPKELIPPRYNLRTELEREIQPGRNTFDFELSSSSASRR